MQRGKMKQESKIELQVTGAEDFRNLVGSTDTFEQL